jgi:hypothetical protein
MKEVSSTSFGLVIAYLLPGFAGFFALSFWSTSVQQMFFTFVEAPSNVGRFLLVILCSLVIGLEISLVRWLLFETLICRGVGREKCDFSELALEHKLAAFRGAVDEYYRYHQFWGGMAVVIPFLGWGIVPTMSTCAAKLGIAIAFLVVETINVAGAYWAFKNYIDTRTRILSKSKNA